MPCSSICYRCVLIWDCSVAAVIHLVSGIIFQIHMNEFSCLQQSMIQPRALPWVGVCHGAAMSCKLVLTRLRFCCCNLLLGEGSSTSSARGRCSREENLEAVQPRDADSADMCFTGRKISLGIKCMFRGSRRNKNFSGLCCSAKAL